MVIALFDGQHMIAY